MKKCWRSPRACSATATMAPKACYRSQSQAFGAKGLLQVPVARLNADGCHELAFGRHRRAAFFYLSLTDPFFSEMPLIVREMDDLAMFEALATENFKRRDINPVEAAEIIHAYMTKYGKTSVEAAVFFGKTEEYIRGTVRLLGLSEPAKEMLRSGEMNVTTARMVLSVQKVLDSDGIETVIEDLKSDGRFDSPGDVIENALSDAQRLDGRTPWVELKTFPNQYLAPLRMQDIPEALGIKDGAQINLLVSATRKIQAGMEITADDLPGFTADQVEKIRIMANPPVCTTTCPVFVQLNHSRYCGLPKCYERKVQAWKKAEIANISKKTGIPLYVNEGQEGKAAALDRNKAADKKLFEERHADLRLMPTRGNETVWGNFQGLPGYLKLVAVGKLAQKRLKADDATGQGSKAETRKTETAAEKAAREQAEAKAQIEMQTHDLSFQSVQRFLWFVVGPAFESLVDVSNVEFGLWMFTKIMENIGIPDVPHGVDDPMDQFEQIQKAKKKGEAIKRLRQLLAFCLFDEKVREVDDWADIIVAKKPIPALVKVCQKIALEWGITLSASFSKEAEKYQAELEKEIKALGKAEGSKQ